MRKVRAALARLAQFPWPVRIEGASGTGKGLAARVLHVMSPRAHGPFVACAVNLLVDTLAIGELLGYRKGAFTGAEFDYMGKFEQAHGGTLFVDEIATASPTVQEALLTLIEGKQVRRIGEQRPRLVDVRLVFATNANLKEAVLAGTFRRDLLYRLGDLPVRMPPLRDHRDDLPELIDYPLERLTRESGASVRSLETLELKALHSYDWPGNVRELEKVLQHFVIFEELPLPLGAASPEADWRERLDQVLAKNGGNRAATARELHVSRKTLYDELKRRKRAANEE
ncbi:MAG: sigma-54-dependent Fis family transcriptional regulator [Gemmatimonadetes bacterium]|nr:sigma-54-dependent Fis family transcriptional regulator [Gemmatimonadota bacterium]